MSGVHTDNEDMVWNAYEQTSHGTCIKRGMEAYIVIIS